MASSNPPRGPKPKTKVLVRNLPWNLPEETFKDAIQEWENTYDYFAFFPGRQNPSSYTNAIAYINFKSVDQLLQFRSKFDGHVFASNKRCHVEYGPYQKVPKTRKPDNRTGTIEADPSFKKWLEERNTPVPPLPSAEEQLQQRLSEGSETGEEKPVTTPLIEHMKAKYLAREAKSKMTRPAKTKRPRNVREIAKKPKPVPKDSSVGNQKTKQNSRNIENKGEGHKKDPKHLDSRRGQQSHESTKPISIQQPPSQSSQQANGNPKNIHVKRSDSNPNKSKPKMNRDAMIMLKKQIETASKDPLQPSPSQKQDSTPQVNIQRGESGNVEKSRPSNSGGTSGGDGTKDF
mmetsp:Transcript_20502/g.28306  ORF Transcript_20502/g.28306 Transcript_20502/m.28306 type:complete len:346 (-) Transcript_20502:269-1306(-)